MQNLLVPELPRIFTLLNGEIEPRFQEVEIASSFQIPHFQMIGLPGPEVSEAKDRIRSAIESSGLEFPKRKIVLNLSPASERKQGTGMDLAMAIAVLLEGRRIDGKKKEISYARIFAWAELGLNGRLKSVRSPARALAASLHAEADLILIAKEDEASFREESQRLFPHQKLARLYAMGNLSEALPFLEATANQKDSGTEERWSPVETAGTDSKPTFPHLLPITPPLARVLEVAAAGSHHFLLLGPKGIGKSLALEWFLALQPALDTETLRTRTFMAEISGKTDTSPYRRVSTQAKASALIGSYSGGALRPGEFSLAHGGVLLADEFPEWHRDAREALREPLERKRVSLTRVDGTVELPCDFVFAGNGNLCACGGVPGSATDSAFPSCRCLPIERSKYLSRLSGPILDRLDLVFSVLTAPSAGMKNISYSEVLPKVESARSRLTASYGKPPGKLCAAELENLLSRTPSLQLRLDSSTFSSFRDRHKTLRIALTLAALQGLQQPDERVFREARLLRLPFG